MSTDEDEAWAAALAPILAKEAEKVWKAKRMPKTPNKAITAAYAAKFEAAVAEGYGVDLNNIDYNTPDGEMLKNLLTNVYQFSAAKNYQQLKQLTQALIDENGKLRTFSQFKKEAFTINATHTITWLRSEYNAAVASATMASKWVEIEKDKAQLPLLQFDAVIDQQTSDICRSLEGVIRPVDDLFWNTWYPPNHWGCRSTVRRLAKGVITPTNAIVYPDEQKVPPYFKTNTAKTGVVFPDGHPYWKDIPKEVKEGAIKLMPYDLQFEPVTPQLFKGLLRRHKLYVEGVDHNDVMNVAIDFAKQGNRVDILPNANSEENWLKVLNPDGKPKKSPDLIINGTAYEVEKNTKGSYRSLKGSIENGANQANRVIILMENFTNIKKLPDLCQLKFKDYPELQLVQFRRKDGTIIFEKNKSR